MTKLFLPVTSHFLALLAVLSLNLFFAEAGWMTTTTVSTFSRQAAYRNNDNNNRFSTPPPSRRWTVAPTTALGVASTSSSTTTSSSPPPSSMPRLTEEQLQELDTKKFVVIPNFISSLPQLDALRHDVLELRNTHKKFNVARIGQDATNTLNTQIRVAETCFIGPSKTELELPYSTSNTASNLARKELYQILDQVRIDLCQSKSSRQRTLDPNLTELLYAYYPQGGYYRRHVDAVAKSASVLRSISLLLYLNDVNWNSNTDRSNENNVGGQLRIHLDSGKDELPLGEQPNFIDIEPRGGTLVLMQSDAIPHEVLDTNRERMAVVGWYNRPVALTDMADLAQGSTGGGGGGLQTTVMLGVAAALVTVGVVQLLS